VTRHNQSNRHTIRAGHGMFPKPLTGLIRTRGRSRSKSRRGRGRVRGCPGDREQFPERGPVDRHPRVPGTGKFVRTSCTDAKSLQPCAPVMGQSGKSQGDIRRTSPPKRLRALLPFSCGYSLVSCHAMSPSSSAWEPVWGVTTSCRALYVRFIKVQLSRCWVRSILGIRRVHFRSLDRARLSGGAGPRHLTGCS
jgi:hypothetical protein